MNGEGQIEDNQKKGGLLSTPDSEVPVSKVLHCRNIPVDTTEQELISLARSFGRVANVLILRGKSQAFIQMEDERAANALIQYYSTLQATIRRNLKIELLISSYQGASKFNFTCNNTKCPISNHNGSPSSRVLKIWPNIENYHFYTKHFIQYANIASAVSARHELDGQNIYQSCCTLKIQFSQLTNLSVKYNNEKYRDFTNPNLPSDPSGIVPLYPDPIPYWAHPPHHQPHPHSHSRSHRSQNGAPYNNNNNNNNHNNNNNNNSNSNHNSHHGNSQSHSNHNSRGNYNHNSNSLPLPHDNYNPYGKPLLQSIGCVLIASGIDSKTTLDDLFTLFGVYGDVVRIKILYNKKDTALLQFSTPQQATTALMNLDGLPFRGNHLKVSYSKHQVISLPKSNEHADSADFTKDYSNSPLHRYKVAGSKNFQHITAPSTVLHISNLPLNINEDYLKDLIGGSRNVVGVKFFQKDRKMALVELETIEDAIEALVEFHDYTIGEQNIRVSFSKSSLN